MEFLYIDKTELIYTNLNNPNPPTINLPYSSISTIFYGIQIKKKFFGLIKKAERYISIQANGNKYIITEKDVGTYKLDEYIEKIKKFAHDNYVTIRETTGSTKEDWRL